MGARCFVAAVARSAFIEGRGIPLVGQLRDEFNVWSVRDLAPEEACVYTDDAEALRRGDCPGAKKRNRA